MDPNEAWSEEQTQEALQKVDEGGWVRPFSFLICNSVLFASTGAISRAEFLKFYKVSAIAMVCVPRIAQLLYSLSLRAAHRAPTCNPCFPLCSQCSPTPATNYSIMGSAD